MWDDVKIYAIAIWLWAGLPLMLIMASVLYETNKDLRMAGLFLYYGLFVVLFFKTRNISSEKQEKAVPYMLGFCCLSFVAVVSGILFIILTNP